MWPSPKAAELSFTIVREFLPVKNEWTQGLNPEQREAAMHSAGPLLILAGAGSGKTTVLVSRTGNLLESGAATAAEICVLTFTTKAAKELKNRVGKKIGSRADALWTGTFHSFGLRLLRKYHDLAGLPSGFGVIDQSDSQEILKDLAKSIRNTAKDSFKVDKLLTVINEMRATGRRSAKNEADEYDVMAEVLLPKYLKRLELLGVVDFEGLLIKPLELFKSEPRVLTAMQNAFKFVMVDEFQDTNVTQFNLVRGLVESHRNIAVVGDDDQSIYGWRGACVSNILDFPKHFDGCRVVRLERNYRSTPAIINVANEVIAKNTTRHGKVLRADPDAEIGHTPEIFAYDNDDLESEEVATHIRYFLDRGYKYSDIAVLYRSNGQGALIEAQLRRNQIPYAITGGTGFFDRKETKDVLAYLRSAITPNEVAFRRIINTPARGIGDTTIERLTAHARAIGFKFHVAARKWREAGVQEKAGEQIDGLFKLLDRLPHDLLKPDYVSPAANPFGALGAEAGGRKTVGENLLLKLREIGYRDLIMQSSKEPFAAEKKWGVVEIFARVLDSFVEKGGRSEKTIHEFADAMELRDASDEETDDTAADALGKVQLLTLHACKGLEFPVVIFVGCEEDLLPHRTLGSDVSEERRLFYVGVTRAKERLILTRAKTRKRFGRMQPVAPSRFLLEIPQHLVSTFDTGFRPVGESQRKNLLADLFKKIDTTAPSQKVER
jgi:superfamily I DNA/RNA helicase